jgi:hypothetical protein
MKKHLYGLAVFSSIVAIAVFVYGYLSVSPIPEIPAVRSEEERPYASERPLKNVAVRVLTAEYDVRTGILAANIELKWNGAGQPPDTLQLSVFLLEKARGPEVWAVESDTVRQPFATTRRFVKRATFSPSAVAGFANFDNIYMYVDAAADVHTGAGLDERSAKAFYVPVLKVHE